MRKLVILLFLFLFLTGLVRRRWFSQPQIVSPLPDFVVSFLPQKPRDQTRLLSEIKKLTEAAGGSWSVYVHNLKTGENFGIDQAVIFRAASANKIPILASLYFLAGRGEIDLDYQITIQRRDIQDYGTGVLRYEGVGKTYSLKTLARLMMEKSDNTAAYLLGRQIIGFEKIQRIINDWGLTQTEMENNKISLLDMFKLLSKMYRGEITNQALTTEMLDFMDDSDFEERIPALLPKKVKVYHKTGDEVGNIHDVGIVKSEKNLYSQKSSAYSKKSYAYFIGVLTSEITDEASAKQLIAKISLLVFNYMEEK